MLQPRRQWRVLVIDDEPVDRELIARMLEAQGHTVMSAVDGDTAIEVARQHNPQVILLDIQLPPSDGYEVCAQLRTERWARAVSIFAITGHQRLEDLQRAHRVGFDGFLLKPLDEETLSRLLR